MDDDWRWRQEFERLASRAERETARRKVTEFVTDVMLFATVVLALGVTILCYLNWGRGYKSLVDIWN